MNRPDVSLILKSEAIRRALNIQPEQEIEFSLLGAGEYNINYLFIHPLSGEKLVLRIPAGSQMQLECQARYEYEALRLLAPTSRTPKPVYIDDSNAFAPYGFLVMNYLPGSPLRYETDMDIAAQILADVHNLRVSEENCLISPKSPLEAMLCECIAMAKIYIDYEKSDYDTKLLINELLENGSDIVGKRADHGNRCIINTELNSGNFLINGKNKENYLVDWEKPLFAYAGQDLGHFLAPTTTFWKTETILAKDEINSFICDYCNHSEAYTSPEMLWETTAPYFAMNCLRGVTWCAMARVEYESDGRILKNQYTYEKILKYTSPDFLVMILDEYIGAGYA